MVVMPFVSRVATASGMISTPYSSMPRRAHATPQPVPAKRSRATRSVMVSGLSRWRGYDWRRAASVRVRPRQPSGVRKPAVWPPVMVWAGSERSRGRCPAENRWSQDPVAASDAVADEGPILGLTLDGDDVDALQDGRLHGGPAPGERLQDGHTLQNNKT